MVIKVRDWNSFNKEEKAILVFGAFMDSLSKNIRRALKKGHSAK